MNFIRLSAAQRVYGIIDMKYMQLNKHFFIYFFFFFYNIPKDRNRSLFFFLRVGRYTKKYNIYIYIYIYNEKYHGQVVNKSCGLIIVLGTKE